MPGVHHGYLSHAILVDGKDLDVSAPDLATLLEGAVVPLLVEEFIDKLRTVFELDVDALAFIGGVMGGAHGVGASLIAGPYIVDYHKAVYVADSDRPPPL
jgi:hypothetical protein